MTVIAADDDAFEADPATEKMLLHAIAQCEASRRRVEWLGVRDDFRNWLLTA